MSTLDEKTKLTAGMVFVLIGLIAGGFGAWYGLKSRIDTAEAVDAVEKKHQAVKDQGQDEAIKELASLQKPLLEQMRSNAEQQKRTNDLIDMMIRERTTRARE